MSALNLNLHYKQGQVLQSEATEILYGGAAGGGKSHLMRVVAILWCTAISGLQVYLFRRVREDLVKNHMEGPSGFRAVLAAWEQAGFVKIVEDEIRFWNGSKIYLCHCKDEKDIYKYQGAEIHVLLIDELTHFTEKMYRFLRNRVRMVGVKLPEQYEGRFPRIICGANPGNIGHAFVKATFVDNAPPMEVVRMPPSEGGMLRQYIPARLSDNPSMAANDPGYEDRLSGLGSEALVRAMKDGDWDVVDGAFFDCWRTDLHVVRPFKIPDHWLKFRSFDWGSARPFSCGWWAVATEDYIHNGKRIPKGAMVRYREWYGAKKDPNTGQTIANVGLKLTAEQVAAGIKEREAETVAYGVADPAIFAEDGGPSIAQMMKGMVWKPADNKRVTQRGAVGGWDQLRGRLKGEDDRPMIYCFDTCKDSIRTIPVLQHDQTRPEDLDSDGEDHAADEWRYACMSRPWVSAKQTQSKPRDRWEDAFEDKGDTSWIL